MGARYLARAAGIALLAAAGGVAMAMQQSTPTAAPPAPHLSKADATHVSIVWPEFAITDVELVDGSGKPALRRATVIIRSGRIASVGAAGKVRVPRGLPTIDGKGKTLLPGFVMMHEHLFYPNTSGDYFSDPGAFSRLYLAAGETTIRTAGSIDPLADLAVARAIRAGTQIGPDIDVTGPYLDGTPRAVPRMPTVASAEDAIRQVDYWAAEGATSFKVYEHITRDELAATTRQAHARGLRVTGHICSVSYREAVEAGIDNIEHGFVEASDFVKDRKLDICSPWPVRLASLSGVDPEGTEIGELIALLREHKVALTSTQGILETLGSGMGRPDENALALLKPELRGSMQGAMDGVRGSGFGRLVAKLFPQQMAMQRRFVREGGLLMAGSDPTGFGGVVPGFSAQREFRLLVEGGFTVPETVRVMTLNGALYLGRDKEIGSIEVGKRADLILIDGSLSTSPGAIDRIQTVFKSGKGYDRASILTAYRGRIGGI
jgi:enamidase